MSIAVAPVHSDEIPPPPRRPEWGASSCPPSTPELVLRTDGCIDVRIPAVLAALLDAAAAAGSDGGSNGRLAAVLSDLVRRRCQQQLLQMSTSLQEDQQQLQQQQRQQQGGHVSDGSGDDGGLTGAVLQYRMAKKQLLHKFAGL